MSDQDFTLMFSVPYPPTLNTYWRHTVIGGRPRTLLSKKGRDYRTLMAQQLRKRNLAGVNLRGSLSVHLEVYPPDHKKRDIDNIPKAILDALTYCHIWLDDSQVSDLRITRGSMVKGGFVNVSIGLLK